MDAVRNDGNPTLTQVYDIRAALGTLTNSTNIYYKLSSSSSMSLELKASIRYQVKALQMQINIAMGSQDYYIRNLRDSLQLFLLLLWPICGPGDLHALACHLKCTLTRPHLRLCASVRLIVWQLLVGAAASEAPSGTRVWYISRLKQLRETMGTKEWRTASDAHTLSFIPDARLAATFELIRQEV